MGRVELPRTSWRFGRTGLGGEWMWGTKNKKWYEKHRPHWTPAENHQLIDYVVSRDNLPRPATENNVGITSGWFCCGRSFFRVFVFSRKNAYLATDSYSFMTLAPRNILNICHETRGGGSNNLIFSKLHLHNASRRKSASGRSAAAVCCFGVYRNQQ